MRFLQYFQGWADPRIRNLGSDLGSDIRRIPDVGCSKIHIGSRIPDIGSLKFFSDPGSRISDFSKKFRIPDPGYRIFEKVFGSRIPDIGCLKILSDPGFRISDIDYIIESNWIGISNIELLYNMLYIHKLTERVYSQINYVIKLLNFTWSES